MKIAFNTRLLASPTLRGWNRYTINLLRELPKHGVTLFLYTDKPIHPVHLECLPKDSFVIRIAPKMNYFIWEQYWLPKQSHIDKIDLFHSPFHFGIPGISPCPCVVTLHDCIDQAYHSNVRTLRDKITLAGAKVYLHHWIARNRATHIITVSHYSKKDLIQHFKLPAHKISVIYEAADAHFHQKLNSAEKERVFKKYKIDCPFIFYVGGLEKRKNIPFLIKTFSQANLAETKLVIAGGKEEDTKTLFALAESLGISEKVRFLGYVDDADLPALYSQALCFIYPSEYEGFGLQVCEAMATGCPTFVADRTALPEILGNGGTLFPLESENLANKLENLYYDSAIQNSMSKLALKRSEKFKWEIAARETTQIYSALLQ